MYIEGAIMSKSRNIALILILIMKFVHRIMEILNVDGNSDKTPLIIKAPVFMLLGRKPGSYQ